MTTSTPAHALAAAHYAEVLREARAAALASPAAITSRPIAPGTFQCVEKAPGYAVRRYLLTGPVEQYSDRDLLIYCEYTPEFGGRVERMPGLACVTVHTD
jgi:hypothetical protein